MNREENGLWREFQFCRAILFLASPIGMDRLLMIGADEKIRILDKMPGFGIEDPNSDGILRLRA
jgi:hypothetical protein